MKMKVFYADGTDVEVVIGPRAQVEVERKFNCLYTDIYDDKSGKARVECFYYSAWAALRYSGNATAGEDFDAWLDKVADVTPVVSEPGKSSPGRPVRPRAGSSS
jgi:hypothetical protein